jgi:hypothetical protein
MGFERVHDELRNDVSVDNRTPVALVNAGAATQRLLQS